MDEIIEFTRDYISIGEFTTRMDAMAKQLDRVEVITDALESVVRRIVELLEKLTFTLGA